MFVWGSQESLWTIDISQVVWYLMAIDQPPMVPIAFGLQTDGKLKLYYRNVHELGTKNTFIYHLIYHSIHNFCSFKHAWFFKKDYHCLSQWWILYCHLQRLIINPNRISLVPSGKSKPTPSSPRDCSIIRHRGWPSWQLRYGAKSGFPTFLGDDLGAKEWFHPRSHHLFLEKAVNGLWEAMILNSRLKSVKSRRTFYVPRALVRDIVQHPRLSPSLVYLVIVKCYVQLKQCGKKHQ